MLCGGVEREEREKVVNVSRGGVRTRILAEWCGGWSGKASFHHEISMRSFRTKK